MPDPRDARVLDPLTAIDLIYGRCRADSLLAFGSRRPSPRKPKAFPHDLFILPVGDRQNWLPAIFAHMVDQSQYIKPSTYTVAAMVEGGVERYRNAIRRGRPLYYAAIQRNVTELVALVVDLDVGRNPGTPGNVTAGQALGAVIDRVQANELPAPSLAAYSGRGAYLWWLLTADDGRPPLNTPDNHARRRLIASELVNRTRDLESDRGKAKDENAWFKRPGTIDTNTDKRVDYLTWGIGHPNAVPLYRLTELVEKLDLYHAPADLTQTAPMSTLPWSAPDPKTPRTPPRKGTSAGNPAAPHRLRVNEITLLAVARDGIHEGMRALTLWHYYHARRMFLVKSTDDNQGAVKRAQLDTNAFNASRCRPPLDTGEMASVFSKLSGKGYSANGPTVTEALRVTREETIALKLESLAHPDIRRERQQEKAAAKAAKAEHRDRVDQLLRDGVSAHEVARQTGTARSTVRYRKGLLRKRGELPNPGAPQEDLDLEDDPRT